MARGVVQGSPISDILFNLAQIDPLQNTRASIPGVTIVSLHDDHFIVGDPPSAIKAAKSLQGELKCIGLGEYG